MARNADPAPAAAAGCRGAARSGPPVRASSCACRQPQQKQRQAANKKGRPAPRRIGQGARQRHPGSGRRWGSTNRRCARNCGRRRARAHPPRGRPSRTASPPPACCPEGGGGGACARRARQDPPGAGARPATGGGGGGRLGRGSAAASRNMKKPARAARHGHPTHSGNERGLPSRIAV